MFVLWLPYLQDSMLYQQHHQNQRLMLAILNWSSLKNSTNPVVRRWNITTSTSASLTSINLTLTHGEICIFSDYFRFLRRVLAECRKNCLWSMSEYHQGGFCWDFWIAGSNIPQPCLTKVRKHETYSCLTSFTPGAWHTLLRTDCGFLKFSSSFCIFPVGSTGNPPSPHRGDYPWHFRGRALGSVL